MQNFVSPGEVVQFTAPSGGVTSGLGYLIGGQFVVATSTVAAGLPFEGAAKGIFDLVKNTGEAWTEGQLIYWDNTNHRCTTTSTSNTHIGYAARLGGELSAAAVGRVRLDMGAHAAGA